MLTARRRTACRSSGRSTRTAPTQRRGRRGRFLRVGDLARPHRRPAGRQRRQPAAAAAASSRSGRARRRCATRQLQLHIAVENVSDSDGSTRADLSGPDSRVRTSLSTPHVYQPGPVPANPRRSRSEADLPDRRAERQPQVDDAVRVRAALPAASRRRSQHACWMRAQDSEIWSSSSPAASAGVAEPSSARHARRGNLLDAWRGTACPAPAQSWSRLRFVDHVPDCGPGACVEAQVCRLPAASASASSDVDTLPVRVSSSASIASVGERGLMHVIGV